MITLNKNFFKPSVSLTVIVVMFLTRLFPHNGSFFKISDYFIFLTVIVGLYFFERAFAYVALLVLGVMSSSSLIILLLGAEYMELHHVFLCQAILIFSLAGGSMILFKNRLFAS